MERQKTRPKNRKTRAARQKIDRKVKAVHNGWIKKEEEEEEEGAQELSGLTGGEATGEASQLTELTKVRLQIFVYHHLYTSRI